MPDQKQFIPITRPVVLIPGIAGSRLETKDRPTYGKNLWMSAEMLTLLPPKETTQQGEEGNVQAAPSVGRFNVPEFEIKAEETPDPGSEWKKHMKVNVYVQKSNVIDGITPLVEVEEPELGEDDKPIQYNKPIEGLEAIENFLPNIAFTEYNVRYYEELVYTLKKSKLYRENNIGLSKKNLLGAPYDWRIAPGGLEVRYKYFTDLKKSIEELHQNALSKRVVIVAHSMGNRVMQYFLQWIKNTQLDDKKSWGQEWIDEHIYRYIAVSPPWLGGPMSIRLLATNDGIKIGNVPLSGMKEVLQSYSSIPWLLPVTENQYKYFNTEHFAYLKKGSGATINDFVGTDFNEILEKGGATSTLKYVEKFYQHDPLITTTGSQNIGDKLIECPPVEKLDVIYSTGFPTAIGAYYEEVDGRLEVAKLDDESHPKFIVKNGSIVETASKTPQTIDQEFPDPNNQKQTNSGDGIVPYGSLTYFKKWENDQKVKSQIQEVRSTTTIREYQFEGGVTDHNNILRDPRVITRILTLIGLLEPPTGEEI